MEVVPPNSNHEFPLKSFHLKLEEVSLYGFRIFINLKNIKCLIMLWGIHKKTSNATEHLKTFWNISIPYAGGHTAVLQWIVGSMVSDNLLKISACSIIYSLSLMYAWHIYFCEQQVFWCRKEVFVSIATWSLGYLSTVTQSFLFKLENKGNPQTREKQWWVLFI